MMIIETIDTAILNLRFITRGRVSVDKLITQLETLKAVIPISPDEAMATCLSFRNDLLPLADIDGLAEDIYLIGFEIYIAIKGWYDGNKYAWRADRKNWDRGDVEEICIGRWESRGGAHFVELRWVVTIITIAVAMVVVRSVIRICRLNRLCWLFRQ